MQTVRALSYNVGSRFYNYFSAERFERLKPLSPNIPLFLFGQPYLSNPSDNNVLSFVDASHKIRDLIVVTYRQGYQFLPNTILSSDAGWGCAIRATQMLIVNTYVQINENLKPDYKSIVHTNLKEKAKHLVFDKISSILSIHNIYTNHHVIEHNPTGVNFLSPSVCALAISELLSNWQSHPFDCVTCLTHVPIQTTPTLYLIPRIITQSEHKFLFKIMKSPLFKGIVGGIGDSAIYIFGSQQQRVFFLDPHYVQNYGDFGYFSPKIYQSDVLRLDSSMVIGMFANNEKEQNDIRELFNMSDKEHQIKEVTNITEMDGFEVLDFD